MFHSHSSSQHDNEVGMLLGRELLHSMPSLGGAGMASATPAEASSSMQQQDEHQTRGQPAL